MNIPNILIADDEVETRNLIKGFLLTRIQCNVFEAENGEKTLESLKKNPCDVMILDIRMPKKSGMVVLDEMKEIAKNVDTIVITAWDSDLVAEECVKRNVEIIPKPIAISELYEKISKLLKKRNQFIPANI